MTDLKYSIIGEGFPVVFIHGFSLDSTLWLPQIEYFKDKFQVITYDLRGFGKSPTPNGEYKHEEDLKELLDTLKITKCHLVGLSIGGEIAIDFALQHKEYVEKLVLLAPSLSQFPHNINWDVNAKEEGLEQARINWLNKGIFEAANNNPAAIKALEKIVKDYSGWHWLNTNPLVKLEPRARFRLKEISCPVMIIEGEKDLLYFQEVGQEIFKNIKNPSIQILNDVGHIANLEALEKVNEIIEKFLS